MSTKDKSTCNSVNYRYGTFFRCKLIFRNFLVNSQTLLFIVLAAATIRALLVIGGVELNPGPGSDAEEGFGLRSQNCNSCSSRKLLVTDRCNLWIKVLVILGTYWKGSRACPNLHKVKRLVKSSYGFLRIVNFVPHNIIWKLYYNVKILPKFKLSDVAEWIRRLTNELEVPGSSPVDTKAFFSSLLFFLAFKRVNLTIFTIFYHQWELLCCVPNC